METKKGIVKWFNRTKGFGFVFDTLNEKEYFFHISHVVGNDTLIENDIVTFDIVTDKRTGKLRADSVTKI